MDKCANDEGSSKDYDITDINDCGSVVTALCDSDKKLNCEKISLSELETGSKNQ